MARPSQKHDPYSALRYRDFRFHLAARFVLTVAIQMQAVIVGWQVYQITGNVLSLGLVGLAEAVPAIGIALFSGHLADKFDRKKIILVFSLLLIASSVFLTLFTTNDSAFLLAHGVWPVYAVIFTTGIARGFMSPALSAFMAQLVPREIYSNSSTWNSTMWQTGAVSGPALGGILYGFAGITYTYGLVVVLMIIAVVLISFIAPKPYTRTQATETLRQRLTSGIRFVFNHQVMLGALSLDMLAVLFGGAVALLPVFASDILHVGPEGLGMLRAAPAFGAIIMAIVLAYAPPTKNAGRKLMFSVAAFGACIIGFALSTDFYLSLVLLALSGMFDNVSVVIRSTILQIFTPDDMRGRVSAVNTIFIGSSNEIGAVESSVAASLLGLVPSVLFGGTVTLVVVGIAYVVAPALRKLDMSEVR